MSKHERCDLVEITCYKCFLRFFVDTAVHEAMRRSGSTFHCPAGHRQFFEPSPETVEGMRRTVTAMLEREEQLKSELKAEMAHRSAIEGEIVELRRRAEFAEARAESAAAKLHQMQVTIAPRTTRKRVVAPKNGAGLALPFPLEGRAAARKD